MTSARKMAAFMLFAALVSGCKHSTPVLTPVAAQAPPLPSKPVEQVASLPPVPQPTTPKVGPPGSDQPPPAPPEKPKRPPRHKPKAATPPPTTPAAGDQTAKEGTAANTAAAPPPPPQQASAGEPPASSPIGQLSSTGGATGTPSRHDILDSIDATEKSLKDIQRTLTPQEQETATQIRTFLTKARQALDQDDLDGANTLTTKAKVLLEELTKS